MLILRDPSPARLAGPLARAAGAGLTYPERGASTAATLPPGYHHVEDAARIGRAGAFADAAEALLAWELHRAAGMVLAAGGPRAEPGVALVNAAPFGPLAVAAPCRVVARVDEPDRRGFAYGSLPGHPLRGEEQFTVERAGEDLVLRIRSFSRPAGPAALAPPLARFGQRAVNRRYLAAGPRIAA